MAKRPLNPTEFASTVSALTSAFGDPTRRDVYVMAQRAEDGITAGEVAERFGIHVNVARHHLDKLAAGGFVEVSAERPSGGARSGAGRPSKRYRAKVEALDPELFVRHDVVLVRLLAKALSLLPREQAETMAEEVGVEYGRALAEAMGDVTAHQRSFRTALHVVAEAMTAHGFAARVDEPADDQTGSAGRLSGLRIVSENCPFGGAEIIHPVICAVDRGMVKGLMADLYGDTAAALESSLLTGADVCVTAVGQPAAPSAPPA